MQIEMITNVAKSERFAPNWTDRAWLIAENSDAVTQTAGNAAALLIGTDATTFTDSASVTRTAGYEAGQPDASGTDLAPLILLLGAWHDTPEAGKRGRIQCSGWDGDVLVDASGTPTQGTALVAVDGDYTLAPVGTANVADESTGALAVIVEAAANIGTADNTPMAVYWRAL